MRLVDTSAWIEWTTGSELGLRMEPHLPTWGDWLVPTVVQYELARWARRVSGEKAAEDIVAFSSQGVLAPLSSPLAQRAAALSISARLAMADAVIYATAIERGAEILTCDAHFQKLDKVIYFAKMDSPANARP
jgi:predicted nucleic acid-binding protein